MITEFNKTNLTTVRADINALLAKYGADNGIDFDIGSISFNGSSFTTKLKATVKGAVTKEDIVLNHVMAVKNLAKKSMCGKTLIEYNTRAGKYPFIYQDAVGKKFKCSEAQAKVYFQF
jgi:hypothetical protein